MHNQRTLQEQNLIMCEVSEAKLIRKLEHGIARQRKVWNVDGISIEEVSIYGWIKIFSRQIRQPGDVWECRISNGMAKEENLFLSLWGDGICVGVLEALFRLSSFYTDFKVQINLNTKSRTNILDWDNLNLFTWLSKSNFMIHIYQLTIKTEEKKVT